MWQRFTRSLKTTFKGRIVGGVASRQPPQAIRNLISYSPSLATVSSASCKQLAQHITRPPTFGSTFSRLNSSSHLSPSSLPRPPAIPGRVTDLGLGTARKFSTARPIFQHLVENVPVAGRAFYEFDIDAQKKQARSEALGLLTKAKTTVKPASLTLQIPPFVSRPQSDISLLSPAFEEDARSESMNGNEEQYDDYFASPSSCPAVITHLHIPLVPIPRPVPYSGLLSSSDPAEGPTLLSVSSIVSEHTLHSTHAARVSSLYARLNTNNVWDRGASCEALFDDSSGLCTALRVTFEGWTEDDVRSVLSLAGNNWCIIWQEMKESLGQQELIMPTLDLSFPNSSLTESDSPSVMPMWDDLWSHDVLSQSEYDADSLQSEVEEWSMDGETEDSEEDSISDLSNFSSGSIVVVA